jgi:hypothetical protein
MKEKELEIYYDHYKDSFSYMRLYLKQRDKYFFYSVIVLSLLFLNSILPNDFEILSKSIIEKNIGLNEFNNFKLIDSILLFSILSIVIKYFQINLLIERQYKYIHHIEKRISFKLEDFNIFREGKAYLKQYPFFSSIIHRIYTIGFPILLILLIVIKWREILLSTENFEIISFFSFNTLIAIIIVILTFFYLIWIHFKDFKKCKKKKNKG